MEKKTDKKADAKTETGMTHAEVITLNSKLGKVKGLKGAELNYAIKKNLKRLKPEIEVYSEQETEIRDICKDFNEEKKKLQEKYATVDGKVKMKQTPVDGGGVIADYDIPADKVEELGAKLKELEKKHKVKLDEADKKWKELMDSRKTGRNDFQIFTIKKHNIPADISTEDMDLIFDLIRENE